MSPEANTYVLLLKSILLSLRGCRKNSLQPPLFYKGLCFKWHSIGLLWSHLINCPTLPRAYLQMHTMSNTKRPGWSKCKSWAHWWWWTSFRWWWSSWGLLTTIMMMVMMTRLVRAECHGRIFGISSTNQWETLELSCNTSALLNINDDDDGK